MNRMPAMAGARHADSRVLRFVATCLLLVPAGLGQSQARLDLLRGDAGSQGFTQALEPRAFEFPRDHGPHPDFRHEWWYLTGQLEAADGKRFGFELTFFRYALVPSARERVTPAGSAWRASQLYMAHFAVTDLDRREFHFAQRHSRAALGLAGAQIGPLRIWLEDWALEHSASGWSLRAAAEGYALDLRMRPQSAEVLNGDAGLSRKSARPGAASYYYSVPRISVSGRLERAGVPLQVSGTAWLDREWGSGSLAADQTGWDWFALQLDDGASLMFYALRRRDGGRDPSSAGTWVDPAGRVRHLADSDLRIDVLDRWTSPRGDSYPSRWRLRSPALALDLTVRPLLADQELQTPPQYWEGAVEAAGRREGRAMSGRGYVELVGYAASK